MRDIYLGCPSNELRRQNGETTDNPGKAFSGIVRKEFGHVTTVGSSLETSGLRLIFLRKIMVIDGFRICHCSIFTSRSNKVVFVWTEIAIVDLYQ